MPSYQQDKGRTIVVMDTDAYETQMKTMLGDNDTYEILKKDPTEEKKRTLKSLLKPLLETKKHTERVQTPNTRRKHHPLDLEYTENSQEGHPTALHSRQYRISHI